MRVHIVSDVHGAADALAAAGDGADMLICLGDMLLFLDYADHTQGIFAELYGAEHAREYIALRVERRFDEARQLTAGIAARLTDERGTDLRTLTDEAIRKQYAAMFGALAEPAYLTYGNVDVPRMWNGYLKPGHQVIDGGRAVVGEVSFGFAGAGLISPYRTPNEIPQLEFAAKHMMITTVKGRFADVRGTITIDEAQPDRSSVEVTLDAKSLDTRSEDRDKHLRSVEFLDVAQFPTVGEHYGLVLSKGNKLVTCVNKALTTLSGNGALARLQQKYLGIYLHFPTIKP